MTSSLYRPELCQTGLEADDASQAIGALASGLLRLGLVRSTFEAAVLQREAASPTGLPLGGRKVAIPHADPGHVVAPGVAAGTLARPVRFGEMGNPQNALAVDVVVLLALPSHEDSQHELVRLVHWFQDAQFVERLHGAADPRTLCALLSSGREPP